MTDLEYALMVRIRDNQPLCDDDLSRAEHLTLSGCSRSRWVHIHLSGSIVLSSRGENALQEHEHHLKQMRDKHADQDKKEQADSAQRVIDEKKSRIHDLKMTILGVVLAYFVEHLAELVDLVKVFAEKVVSHFR